jgi:hypothetical protein
MSTYMHMPLCSYICCVATKQWKRTKRMEEFEDDERM